MTIDCKTSKLLSSVLAAEFGMEHQLQIGLFEEQQATTADLPAAQERFSQLLLQTIRQANSVGAHTLLAGEALAPVASGLPADGHNIVWLSGETAQTHPLHGLDTLTVVPASLLTYATEERFDCIVVAGTYRYLDQLPILSRCREFLRSGGRLLVFGEFLQDDSAIARSSLANLSSQTQLAERLGYVSEQCTDLSKDALHSVRLFNGLLEKHAAQVCKQLALDAKTWSQSVAAYALMQQELESGRRCFQLHQWQLPDPLQNQKLGEYAQAEYGDISTFNVPEIKNLFEQSFEKSFDPELWRWKYQLGKGQCVVARIEKSGEIVAHYGGAPREILYFGEPEMAIQVCDVMVLPEKRRQYGKSSLFFKVAATFLEREIGNSVNHLLGFGFPNQSAMNIATRLGLYEKTDDFVEIQYSPPAEPVTSASYVDFDVSNAQHRDQLELLWRGMAVGFADGIIGLRGADYLQYRYSEHPGARSGQYRCLLLPDDNAGDSLAFVVLKAHGESQLLMDMVCSMDRMSEVITNINQIVSAEYPGQDLRFWLTRGWLSVLPKDGAIVNELGIEIPCNSWNPGPDSASLHGKWWLTAGDMDFM